LTAGLFVDMEFKFLGGTPDGLIEKNEIIKIRCPESWEKLTIADGAKRKNSFLSRNDDNTFQLKKNRSFVLSDPRSTTSN